MTDTVAETQEPARSKLVVVLAKEGMDVSVVRMNLQDAGVPTVAESYSQTDDKTAYTQRAVRQALRADCVVVDMDSLEDVIVPALEEIAAKRTEDAPAILTLAARDRPDLMDTAFRNSDRVLPAGYSKDDLLRMLNDMRVLVQRMAHRVTLRTRMSWTRPDGSRVQAETSDLSVSGLGFHSAQPIPVGQNVPVEIYISKHDTAKIWIRVMRCNMSHDRDRPQFTAAIGAQFISLSPADTDLLRHVVTSVRRREHEAEVEHEQFRDITNDYATQHVLRWLSFLHRPTSRLQPPEPLEPTDPDERVLTGWLALLLPHEEIMLQLEKKDQRKPDKWMRSFIALRVLLKHAADNPPKRWRDDDNLRVEYCARSAQRLERLSTSLSLWGPTYRDDADANVRHTITTAITEALRLRDVYEGMRTDDDPSYLMGLENADLYFSEEDLNALDLMTFDQKVFRAPETQKSKKKKKILSEEARRARRKKVFLGLQILVGVVALSIVGYRVYLKQTIQGRNLAEFELLEISDLLAEASVTEGKGHAVMFGQLKNEEWVILSRGDRIRAARSIRAELIRRNTNAALLFRDNAMAIHIEEGHIVFVE